MILILNTIYQDPEKWQEAVADRQEAVAGNAIDLSSNFPSLERVKGEVV